MEECVVVWFRGEWSVELVLSGESMVEKSGSREGHWRKTIEPEGCVFCFGKYYCKREFRKRDFELTKVSILLFFFNIFHLYFSS